MITGQRTPLVGVVMGSASDLPTMQPAADALAELGVPHEVRVVSAHRGPLAMVEYAETAADRGLRVLVAGAGGAAHLPGMLAALCDLPVVGVPVARAPIDGLDALLSIVQMPGGVPVATMAVDGARNAGLFAARLLALHDPELAEKVAAQRLDRARLAEAQDEEVRRVAGA